MRLHKLIKDACAKAGPEIAAAAGGSEAAIYMLAFRAAEFVDALEHYGSFVDALDKRGLTLKRKPRRVIKCA